MRILALCSILLAMAFASPGTDDPAVAAWTLGILMLLAFGLEHVAAFLGLPSVIGWLAAGIILGAYGLQTARPAESETLGLVFLMAALWIGLQTGLRCSSSRPWNWHLSGVIGLSTLLVCVATAFTLFIVLDISGPAAVLVGVIVCLWDPIVVSSLTERDDVVTIAILGSGASLIVLSGFLLVFAAVGSIPPLAVDIVLALWMSAVAGAVTAEALWRVRVFDRRATAITAVAGCFVAASIGIREFGLYALPFGISAGIVLAVHDGVGHQVRRLFEPGRQVSAILFFALAAATVEFGPLHRWWPPQNGLLQVLAVALLLLVTLRVIGPITWFPVAREQGGLNGREAWLLLPKGAILFELTIRNRSSLLQLVGPPVDGLLRQYVFIDLIVFGVVLCAGASVLYRLLGQRLAADPESSPEHLADESPSAR